MINLTLDLEPVWVDCPFSDGVRVQLRRLTSMDMNEARQVAMAVVRKMTAGGEALAPYGLDGEDAHGVRANPADPAQAFRLGLLVEVTEVGFRGVRAWEGITNGMGQPAPVNRKTLATLLLDDRFDRWLRGELNKACVLLVEEKKTSTGSASGGAADGKTASGLNTAATAARPGNRARKAAPAERAATARKPSTRPSRSKG